jgi:hypothetical protein
MPVDYGLLADIMTGCADGEERVYRKLRAEMK